MNVKISGRARWCPIRRAASRPADRVPRAQTRSGQRLGRVVAEIRQIRQEGQIEQGGFHMFGYIVFF